MPTDRTGTIAATAAHDLNNELTVILNSVTESLRHLEAGHPSHGYLLELRASAQRCVSKAAALLSFCARHNHRSARASFESLTRA
jgi:hypothetical protein